jgi:IS5 family transposase
VDARHHSKKAVPVQRQEFPLLDHLHLPHPLIVLTKLIDSNAVDQVAYKVRGPRHRSRPLRPRLVAGLLYLQHTFDLCDEEIVRVWVKTCYWQGFYRRDLFANRAVH